MCIRDRFNRTWTKDIFTNAILSSFYWAKYFLRPIQGKHRKFDSSVLYFLIANIHFYHFSNAVPFFFIPAVFLVGFAKILRECAIPRAQRCHPWVAPKDPCRFVALLCFSAFSRKKYNPFPLIFHIILNFRENKTFPRILENHVPCILYIDWNLRALHPVNRLKFTCLV